VRALWLGEVIPLAKANAEAPMIMDPVLKRWEEMVSDLDHRVREKACWILGEVPFEFVEAHVPEGLLRIIGERCKDVKVRCPWDLSTVRMSKVNPSTG
jgi:hypothetical protein